jgi:hypothetical protein
MARTAGSPFGFDLAEALHESFIEGVSWPIDRASLAALLDMGLSPQQIAQYFSVSPAEVIRLVNATGAAGTTPSFKR